MTPEHLELYRQLSETKIYKERFGRFDLKMKPPVFDPENPERGLWGMVDWNTWQLSNWYGQIVSIRLIDDTEELIHDRLDIALIKAILKQEEG
jgi:hypothetical protein